jgi:NAD(P)-dependent dehydrogenase (short-subunit alcohol dehydrogenase family)
MTDHRLNNLRVAVTGGTSGLGRGLVRELLERGSHVAFVARHRADVERTMLDFPAAHGIVGDVGRKEDVHPIAIQILAALDGLDILINNASSLGPVPLRPLADTACEDLELALATNLVGPFRLTKALLGSLAAAARAGGSPLVINVSSDAAVTPYENWGAYGASKAALQHLTRIWDAELAGEGVRMIAVDPGDMDTPLHALAVPDADLSTLKRPETAAREIADLIAGLTRGDSGSGTPEGVPYVPRAEGVPSVPWAEGVSSVRRAPFQGRRLCDAEVAR